MEATVPLVIVSVAVAFLVLGAIVDDRRARARRRAVGRIELPLLHSINDDRCIGCEACVDVCPTQVLDLVNHIVRVARFSDCVQCEQCANACPTTALVMYREGTVPRTLTVPELDDHFQTGVTGQYLIGEVAGKPLVKNAANLGRAVIEHIAKQLSGSQAAAGVLDVAIVGSGPGGLSAGLTCIKRRLSVVVLEKEHVISSTVSRYPKGKHFMAEPSSAVNLSFLPVFDASKEQLVGAWQRVVEGAKLPIKLGEAVETVKRGDDGIFEIKTTVATYRARTVVLATGLRGKPRLLVVPGANLEKVQSLLDDPAEFASEHVLVVGGGDSAVEGAMSLAEAGATVTLSYRGDGFKRCKQGNQKRLAEMTAAGRVSVLLESNVKEFTDDAVTIKLKDGTMTTIPNQRAFVLIGADTPVAWLEANNVRFVEREHLYALGSTEDVVKRAAPDAVECSRSPEAALAVVLGKTPPPSRPSRTEHSFIGQIRSELREVVSELTGVFKIATLDEPPPRHARAATVRPRERGDRTPHPRLIPSASLTRVPPARPAPTKLFAHHDRVKPFTPSDTTLEIRSLPALLKSQPATNTASATFVAERTVTDARPYGTTGAASRAATQATGPAAIVKRPLRRGAPVAQPPAPPPAPSAPPPAPRSSPPAPPARKASGGMPRSGMAVGAHPTVAPAVIAPPPPIVAPAAVAPRLAHGTSAPELPRGTPAGRARPARAAQPAPPPSIPRSELAPPPAGPTRPSRPPPIPRAVPRATSNIETGPAFVVGRKPSP